MRTASPLRSGTLPSLLRDSPGPSTRMRVGGGPCWSLTLATLAGVRSIAIAASAGLPTATERPYARQAMSMTQTAISRTTCVLHGTRFFTLRTEHFQQICRGPAGGVSECSAPSAPVLINS